MRSATKSLLSLCAADIMSHNIVMIPREMSLQGAARMLARANVTGAPVVDTHGHCIGVLSATDFMHWVEKDQKPGSKKTAAAQSMCLAWQLPEGPLQPSCCVEEFMTKDPVLVTPGTRIGELARMMIDAHIHRVIVVDAESQRPIGIVSSMDILAVLARIDQMQMQPTAEESRPREVPVGVLP
jgi:CBS domain-containing protein